MQRSRDHGRERGAAASLLVVAGVLVGLAVFTLMVFPIATATDAKSRNRTAADAAALAGAEGIVGDLESVLLSGSWSGGWGNLADLTDSGLTAAQNYMSRNDSQARLVSYSSRLEGLTWVVEAEVESPPVKAGTNPVRSYARAEVGLPNCSFDYEEVEPTPTPEPTEPPEEGEEPPEETPPPPPQPGPDRIITCDGREWIVEDQGTVEDPDYELPGGLISALLDDLKPRLVA
ncbi:hypothetical protein [Aeromicrobium camelliae]|uniref:hypothetical protein n=1 Tax=Aeromicrobium camelliae TaxID=1538144 RepID=UPI001408411B|nr:hypothetical protein [Aeromicrobium camelliae]